MDVFERFGEERRALARTLEEWLFKCLGRLR